MRILQISVTLLLGVIIGVSILLYQVQKDSYFHSLLQQRLESLLSKSLLCHFRGTVSSLNLLAGTVQLTDVSVCASDGVSWKWETKKLQLSCVWWKLLFGSPMDLYAHIDHITVQTNSHAPDIAITEHLKKLLGGIPGVPISFRGLDIVSGSFLLHDQSGCVFATDMNMHAELFPRGVMIHLQTQKGVLKQMQKSLLAHIAISLTARAPRRDYTQLVAAITGSCIIPQNADKPVYVRGSWQKEQGTMLVYDEDRIWNVALEQCSITSTGLQATAQAHIPLQTISKLFGFSTETIVDGAMQAHVHFNSAHTPMLEARLSVDQLKVQETVIGSLHTDITYKDGTVFGTLAHQKDVYDKEQQYGSWEYNPITDQGSFQINNIPDCIVSYLGTVTAGIEHCVGTFSRSVLKTMHVQGHIMSSQQKQSKSVHVRIQPDDAIYAIQGQCGDYMLTATWDSSNQCADVSLIEKQEQQAYCHIDVQQKSITGSCEYRSLQALLEHCCGQHIVGQGTVTYAGQFKDMTLTCVCAMQQGNIRIPQTYNLLQSCAAQIAIDFSHQRIQLNNVSCALDRGIITCPQAVFYYNDRKEITYAYVPCCLSKVLCALDKDMLVVVSGQVHGSKQATTPWNVQGNIIIDRGYIKKNIFSQSEHKQYMHTRLSDVVPCQIDLTIQNKEPLHIETLFLNTRIGLQLGVQGLLPDIKVSGAINLLGGSLAFPYKPLAIHKGSIYFTPEQWTDPLVELVAQAKVRKYAVTLRCNGSLQKPVLMFESSPTLTEEQILTLLLAGSEEGSLSVVMPALIMQSAQQLLFGSEQEMSKVQHYFQRILKSLRYIRFVPKFFDQTARGGFRGAIEVEVNDQLRGIVQRNFSLPEDMRYEVEYYASDDMTVRGIRDERGDFGGEVELRWRF